MILLNKFSRTLICLVVATASVAAQDKHMISGRVTDALGCALPNVSVTATEETGKVRTSKTDAEGKYQIANVEGKNASMTVDEPGFIRAQRSVQLAEAQVTAHFGLLLGRLIDEPAKRIQGHVRAADGRGVPDASVMVTSPYDVRQSTQGMTNREGAFSLSVVEPGWYIVVISKPGFEHTTTALMLRSTDVNPAPLNFVLKASSICC